MRITVAICTWNRSKLLNETLRSLCDLRIPSHIKWELVVVNNCCTDDTDRILALYKHRLPLRILHESIPGHSHARNRAIAHAAGDVIVWTDDDVRVRDNWLSAYAQAFSAYPRATYCAGPVEPWFESEPPRWFRRHLGALSGIVVCVDHGDELRPLRRGESIFGANMAVRTDVARDFPFHTRLGRVKASLIGGDDTDFLDRLQKAGHEGVWVPEARVLHFVPRARIQPHYVERWFRDAGRTHARLCPIEGARVRGIPRWLLREYIAQRGKALLWRPLRNEKWFAAYRQSLMIRGMIDETREG